MINPVGFNLRYKFKENLMYLSLIYVPYRIPMGRGNLLSSTFIRSDNLSYVCNLRFELKGTYNQITACLYSKLRPLQGRVPVETVAMPLPIELVSAREDSAS